jgi:hypothetical protein
MDTGIGRPCASDCPAEVFELGGANNLLRRGRGTNCEMMNTSEYRLSSKLATTACICTVAVQQ